MTITNQSIVQRVAETIQDLTSVRWTVGELARYFNDAVREVVMHRPDATATTATITCAAGARQAIPTAGAKLLDVVRNVTTGKTVRMADKNMLDAQVPGWYALTGSTGVVHFTYDARDPKVFYVYPPATNATQLEITYSAHPADITEPGSGTYTAITGNLGLPDVFANAIADYMLYRCYAKDSTYAGNMQRAQAHYAVFANALGIEIKATVSMQPAAEG